MNSRNRAVNNATFCVLAAFAFTQCSKPPREFARYEINPLKEAVAKNNVSAYVEFGYRDGKYFEADSVSFDEDGYVTSRIAVGGVVNEQFYTYDSLHRLVFETQRSDIYTEITSRYDTDPDEQIVVKDIFLDVRWDSLRGPWHREILKYDQNLSKILTKTDIGPYGEDTVITHYEYTAEAIQHESSSKKGQIGWVTTYSYADGRISQINRSLDKIFSQTDYYSKDTGLVDSTVMLESLGGQTDKSVKYYKYYYR